MRLFRFIIFSMLVTILLALIVWKQPIPELEMSESLARFSLVAVAEVLAFAIFITPLLVNGNRNSGWRNDCLRYGLITAGVVLSILVCFFSASQTFLFSHPNSVRWLTEYLIILIYFINLLGLSHAIVRTGGPAKSLYASLLPIQFAGFLLLELQKELSTGLADTPNYLVYTFAVLTLIAWFTTHIFRDRPEALIKLNDTEPVPDFSNWIVYLSAAGMLLTALGHFLPRQAWFISIIKHRFKG
jgi:hypothetical protein